MDGPFVLVIDPFAFQPLDEYQAAVRSFLDGMKAAQPAPGIDEVLVPGDYEARSREQRIDGIEITDKVRAALERAAESPGDVPSWGRSGDTVRPAV